MGGMGGMGSMGGMGGGGMSPMGMDFMGGMGAGGMGMMNNEAMFKTALHSSILGQAPSSLQLLLPRELIHRSLVPNGVFNDICQRCGVRIDLGAEVPTDMQQVSCNGTVAANAMAAFLLQERSVQYGGLARR
mmetsp:Transcript_81273/g.209200  ORF Transcript_81273/g.209200 Transcript_81273/m.209200 type:complete len:132 (+) Transcript_81273:1-396(+)